MTPRPSVHETCRTKVVWGPERLPARGNPIQETRSKRVFRRRPPFPKDRRRDSAHRRARTTETLPCPAASGRRSKVGSPGSVPPTLRCRRPAPMARRRRARPPHPPGTPRGRAPGGEAAGDQGAHRDGRPRPEGRRGHGEGVALLAEATPGNAATARPTTPPAAPTVVRRCGASPTNPTGPPRRESPSRR